jgi:hypothetical protein
MQTIFKQITGRINGAFIWAARLIAKLRQAMDVPIGYQDETGYHAGVEPILQRIESFTQPSPSAFAKLRRDKLKNRSPFP